MSLLLGVPDGLVKENETTTWETSKIGGLPDWFQENLPLPSCTKCRKEMMLVTQVYCPLADSLYHRCLHIFVCPSRSCSTQNFGWKVVRTQLLEKTATSQQDNTTVSAEDIWTTDQDDWGVGQDDWGDDDEDDDDHGEDIQFQGESQQAVKDHVSTISPENVAADRLSKTTVASDHPQEVVNSSPRPQADSAPRLCSGQNGTTDLTSCHINEHCPDETSVSESECEDSISNYNDVEPSDEVLVKGPLLDDESIHRMMGLMAIHQDPEESKDNFRKESTAETAQKLVFPAYYLQVFDESDMKDDLLDHAASLLQEYEQREGQQVLAHLSDSRKGQAGADAEKYEKTQVKHGDKQCYKFIKQLQKCPQQCIRYQWKGKPLLITKPKMPLTAERCEKCKEPRLFELQLVPPLIPLLSLPTHPESLVEFGTVLVFTCSSSCWSNSEAFREERVILQHDPDQHRFN